MGVRVDTHVKVFELMPTGLEGVLRMNRKLLKSFFSHERGTETVEWGLIVGLVVGGLVLTVAAIGIWIQTRFDNLQTELGTP